MNILLVGNPNSGKTTLFNLLTGANQQVGNWPGVTVEKKEGYYERNKRRHTICDLPGIYSLEPDSLEQKIARNYILENEDSVIINILDVTNLERNLYLTMQLLMMDRRMIVALNMSDELRESKISATKLSEELGVPVVNISALKNVGVAKLMDMVLAGRATKPPEGFCLKGCSGCTSGEKIYTRINKVKSICVCGSEKAHRISEKLDKVLLNRVFALPAFILIMFGVFNLTFGPMTGAVSDGIAGLLENQIRDFFSWALEWAPWWIKGIVVDGILPGVGMVLVFLPQITVLFVLMSILEFSGYMSRVAFILDRIMSWVGLSGSSFIPLLMGFGCSVPAVMSCRSLPTEKDRRLTIMLMPFISCNARLPVYALLAGVFFPKNQSLVIMGIYFLGIMVAMLVAIFLSKTLFKSENTTFMMEIPPYRLPEARSILFQTWEKVKGFLVKAGTILLAASIGIWIVQTLTPQLTLAVSPDQSILAGLGRLIAPLFAPLGFGNWQSATALLIGIPAKEMIVAALSMFSQSQGQQDLLSSFLVQYFSVAGALSFMVFSLIYMPCLSTIVVMKRELNSWKYTIITLVLSFTVAWLLSWIIYNVAGMVS